MSTGEHSSPITMQETRRKDLRQLEGVMKETEETATADHFENNPEKDSASVLQPFLDRIPINSSIPGIKNAPVVDLKTGDNVKDAIELLYTKNAFGAPIADDLDPDITVGRFPDRYIGFIDFATMVLWSLEKCEKAHIPSGKSSIWSLLEQNPEIGNTKVGELAKSFLWNPFFPVRLEDTLFHVLLLLSKHPVQVVPVVQQSLLQVIGFITQVDDLQRPLGVLTLRDIILQFAPPSMNSNIDGGGFFESALEQTGCQVKDGTLVCDH